MRKSALGITTVVIGVTSLGVAAVPCILFDMPPPWKSIEPTRPNQADEGVVEWHGVKVSWKGKSAKASTKPEMNDAAARYLVLAGALLGLLGLIVGPLALWRERSCVLAIPGMSFCVLALTWQYFIVGIAVGAALAVFVALLAALSNG
jgi:hypothetical protein